MGAAGLEDPTDRRRLLTQQIVLNSSRQVGVVVVGPHRQQLRSHGAAFLDLFQRFQGSLLNQGQEIGAEAQANGVCQQSIGIQRGLTKAGCGKITSGDQSLVEPAFHRRIDRRFAQIEETFVARKEFGLENFEAVEFAEQVGGGAGYRTHGVGGMGLPVAVENLMGFVKAQIVERSVAFGEERVDG